MTSARAFLVGCVVSVAVLVGSVRTVRAQDPTPQQESPTAFSVPTQSPILIDGSLGKLMIAGYAEGFYQWNFNRPPSGITNYRGFDNRHNAFTIANAVVDAQYEKSGISARIALQIGHTPNTYYLAEPSSRADLSSSVIGPSDAATWRFIQQAILGYKIALGRGLLIQAGVFLSPIGPESMAVRENWMFSHSDLFFNLPFYHTGVRLTQQLSEAWSATIGVVNGWNSVVDNNGEKSLYGQLYYNRPDRLQASLLYFTGVERNPLDASRSWRHLIDAWATLYFGGRFAFGLHGSLGVEPQQSATAMWLAGATYVRLRIVRWLQLAARGDVIWERHGELPIFFPAAMNYLASGTATLEFNVASGLLVRIEYRHDHSDGEVFFTAPSDASLFSARDVETDRQDTLTVGAVVWF
ncbi:MAG: porin [Myxococcales bacterium]|nr:porin [Myxococcales bacterium]